MSWKKELFENLFSENKNKIKKGKEELNKHFPQYLFKYRFNENHIKALEENKLYLSNPLGFNDPYDSSFSIINKIDFVKFWSLLEFGDTEHGLNNFNEGEKFIDDNLNPDFSKNIAEIFKITCFSTKVDSLLMWTHYSNEHKGFCIGYDTTNEIKFNQCLKSNIFPVLYTENLFDVMKFIQFDDVDDSEYYRVLLRITKNWSDIIKYYFEDHIHNVLRPYEPCLTKFKDWSYEEEWRFVTNKLEYKKDYMECIPSNIYLGARFDGDINDFKRIAKDKNCELYKMKLHPSKFKLIPEKI